MKDVGLARLAPLRRMGFLGKEVCLAHSFHVLGGDTGSDGIKNLLSQIIDNLLVFHRMWGLQLVKD